MRKQKLFAVILAGTFTVILAGCATDQPTAEKETNSKGLRQITEAEQDNLFEVVRQPIAIYTDLEKNHNEQQPDDSANDTPIQTTEPAVEPAEAEPTEQPVENPATPPPKESKPSVKEDTSKPKEPPRMEATQPEEVPVQEPAQIEEPAPETVVTEPPKPKSIYDYEFDIEAIRQELIALGEGMGLTHTITDDGRVITPDTASWATPVTASQSFQGTNLERRLKNYVQSMPGIITAYGGNPITFFTIYIEPLESGSYRIYFLY